MGVKLEARGQVQVSINMTNFEKTPLHRVFETVQIRGRAPRRPGRRARRSSGLVPQAALLGGRRALPEARGRPRPAGPREQAARKALVKSARLVPRGGAPRRRGPRSFRGESRSVLPTSARTLERLVRAAAETNGAYDTIREPHGRRRARGSRARRATRARSRGPSAALKARGFSNVHAEPVTVPHWERGEESGEIVSPVPLRLSLCALGGSVGNARRRGRGGRRRGAVARGRRRARREGEGEDRPRLEGHGAPRGRVGLRRDGSDPRRRGLARREGGRRGRPDPVGRRRRTRDSRTRARCATTRASRRSPPRLSRIPTRTSCTASSRTGRPCACDFDARRPDASRRGVGERASARSRAARSRRRSSSSAATSIRGTSGRAPWTTAAGCGIAIEAARLIGQLPKRPRRTIRVVLVRERGERPRGSARLREGARGRAARATSPRSSATAARARVRVRVDRRPLGGARARGASRRSSKPFGVGEPEEGRRGRGRRRRCAPPACRSSRRSRTPRGTSTSTIRRTTRSTRSTARS